MRLVTASSPMVVNCHWAAGLLWLCALIAQGSDTVWEDTLLTVLTYCV